MLDQLERPPETAGADVRARRLDERPGDDRRHDRQQLGRRPVAALWQDGRSRPCRRGRPGRRHHGDVRSALADDELDGDLRAAGSVGLVHRAVRDTVAAHRQAIVDRFPKILRRVSGYNLDEFVPGLPVRPVGWPDEPWQFNLARLIVGSEGTLAVVTGAELKVVPIPPAQGLVVLSFATIPAALDRLAEIVATGPVAVEMLDRMILELAARTRSYSHYLNFAEGRPAAVLAAQFYADSPGGAGRAGRRSGPAVRGPAGRARRPQAA